MRVALAARRQFEARPRSCAYNVTRGSPAVLTQARPRSGAAAGLDRLDRGPGRSRSRGDNVAVLYALWEVGMLRRRGHVDDMRRTALPAANRRADRGRCQAPRYCMRAAARRR